MLCMMQSVISYISISFDNVSLGNYYHDNEVKRIHVKREDELSSPEFSIVDKGPRKTSVEIQLCTFRIMIL